MTEPLVAHDPTATLIHGGIAALGAKLADDLRTSPVAARSYAHPALDGKVIVRLEPEAIAAGTDAEMAAFGFAAPEVSAHLGQVRYRTLGFPAWALVHEPKKAKAALDVTEAVRKAKRLVQSKPGHAKEAFENIAKTLSRSAPQFLPSFWEEVGRVVADQASATMAAQCFERARQAERAYKLRGDPDDQDAVFVEFALLGALSAKSLSQYARELVKSAGGREAHRRFRSIVVKRALGGMPPYAGMGKDVRALAEAAKLDVDADERALVAELIDAPGIGRAPIEFWNTHRAAIVAVARERREVRARLAAVWPDPRGGNDDAKLAFKQSWIELLDELGALDGLPDEGLGAWFGKLFKYVGKTPRTEAILRRHAPRLAALGQSVAVITPSGWPHELDLDLAELALELGVVLADPRHWDDFAPDSMTCDPVRVAAEPRYGKKLIAAVENMMGDPDHEHRMAGKAGFAAARRAWIAEQLSTLDGKPLVDIATALDALDAKTTAETFLPYPDLHQRLARADLSPSLAHQLRGGLVDEFGWPAFEIAFVKLGGEIKVGGAFPILTLWNQHKAIAIGKHSVVAEHDLVYKPKEHTVDGVYYLDGQFLVELDPKRGWKHVGYWSSAPKQVFELGVSYSMWGGNLRYAWSPPSGGVTLGGKAFRAGEHQLSDNQTFLSDSRTMWVRDGKGYRVFDPATGKKGAEGGPPFVTEWKREGWTIDHASILLPAPLGLDETPLGMKDGLLGLRVRGRDQNPDDPDDALKEYERIDGQRCEDTRDLFALVTFPGDDAPRRIAKIQADAKRFPGGDGPGVQLFGPTGGALGSLNEHLWASRGWGDVYVPPATFWAYLVARDVPGSRALRAVTVEQARAILDRARIEVAAGGELGRRALDNTEAEVRAAFPSMTDAKLVRGIVGIAEQAAELAVRTAALADARSKDNADPSGQALVGQPAQVRKLSAALTSGRPAKLTEIDVDLGPWLAHPRALAALSYTPIAEPDDRRKARDMARALAGTIFADDLANVRWLETEDPDDWNDYSDDVMIVKHDASTFAIHASNNWAIELTTDGTFRVPTPWKIVKEKRPGRGIGTDWAQRFAELPDEPPPWDPVFARRIAERTDLSIAEATLLAVGAPDRDAWHKDFLGKVRRERLGLKLGEADTARMTFKGMEDDKLHALIDRAVPDDAGLLAAPLAPRSFLDRLGDAWKAKFGKRAKIPSDLVAAARKSLPRMRDELAQFLPVFAGGDDDVWFLRRDPRPIFELSAWGDKEGLDPDAAAELASLVAWLFLARPVGCPIRAGIVRIVRKLGAVLDHPRTLWPLGQYYADDEDARSKARSQALIDVVGGEPVDFPNNDDEACVMGRDDGAVVIAAYPTYVYAGFRPAKLNPAAIKKVDQLVALLQDSNGDDHAASVIRTAQALKSDGFAAFAERVADTPVADGGFEANPLVSAPKLVAKVTKAHDVSEHAAALYLQILALAEPTQRNIVAWNGWTPKAYQAASAELVKAKLVVEGKRERTGRTIFIKGSYTKGDGANLPMEEWKAPFYQAFDRNLPAEPCHLLFARAWKRVEAGDKP